MEEEIPTVTNDKELIKDLDYKIERAYACVETALQLACILKNYKLPIGVSDIILDEIIGDLLCAMLYDSQPKNIKEYQKWFLNSEYKIEIGGMIFSKTNRTKELQ